MFPYGGLTPMAHAPCKLSYICAGTVHLISGVSQRETYAVRSEKLCAVRVRKVIFVCVLSGHHSG
jgi:hypothetical protein